MVDPTADQTGSEPTLLQDLERVINRHSRENGSNTPDFLLAEYLQACLTAYESTVKARAAWYGRMDTPGAGSLPYKKEQA